MKVRKMVVAGEKRCLQACFRMVVDALTGTDPGRDYADAATGYVPGRGTWQFRTLLAFAQLGLDVVYHEAFDVDGFVRAPECAIRRQVQDPSVVAQFLKESDLLGEAEALQQCLLDPSIRFVDTIPTMTDMLAESRRDRLLIWQRKHDGSSEAYGTCGALCCC